MDNPELEKLKTEIESWRYIHGEKVQILYSADEVHAAMDRAYALVAEKLKAQRNETLEELAVRLEAGGDRYGTVVGRGMKESPDLSGAKQAVQK